MADTPPRIVILNPNATRRMTDDMVASARRAAGPTSQVTGLTNHDGPASIQGPEDVAACLTGLFDLFDRALSEGAEGVIIGCFDDTGLQELRARGSVPVTGLGEAGCLVASLAAPQFAVVTTLEVSVPVISDNIRAMGLWPRCTGVFASGVAVLEVGDGPQSLARVQRSVDTACAAPTRPSVVLGCGGMTVIAPQLTAPMGACLVDPVRAALHLSHATVMARGRGDPVGD